MSYNPDLIPDPEAKLDPITSTPKDSSETPAKPKGSSLQVRHTPGGTRYRVRRSIRTKETSINYSETADSESDYDPSDESKDDVKDISTDSHRAKTASKVETDNTSEPLPQHNESDLLDASHNSQVQQIVSDIEKKSKTGAPTSERKRKHLDEGNESLRKKGRGQAQAATMDSTSTEALIMPPQFISASDLDDKLEAKLSKQQLAMQSTMQDQFKSMQKNILESVGGLSSKIDDMKTVQDADRVSNAVEFARINSRQDKIEQIIEELRHERKSEGTCQGMQVNDVSPADYARMERAKRTFHLDGVKPSTDGDNAALETEVRAFLTRVAGIKRHEVDEIVFESVSRIKRWEKDPTDPTKPATQRPTRGVYITLPEDAHYNGHVKKIAASRKAVNDFNDGEPDDEKCHIYDHIPGFLQPLERRLKTEARLTRDLGYLRTTVRWTNDYNHLTVWVMSNPDNKTSKDRIKTWTKREEAVGRLGETTARIYMDKRAFYANRQSIST